VILGVRSGQVLAARGLAMGTVAAALTLIVGLLFAATPADASKRKSKSDDAEMKEAFKKGRKRSASDPVLRRYGKKAEYVLASDYEERSKKRSQAKASKAEKPVKVKQPKRPKPVEVDEDEDEVVVIEEDAPKKLAKKPAKKSKPQPDDNEVTITEGW
jgi:hypothetical protein